VQGLRRLSGYILAYTNGNFGFPKSAF